MILTAVVDFETAKLLRDKEFENKNPNKLRRSYYNHLGEYRGDVTEYLRALVRKEDTKPFESVDAPTIGQVVDWLFEEHGIWITVCVIGSDGFGYWLHNKDRERLNPGNQGGYWLLPTKAYEAAITHCLEQLI
jgi:hypothetical protein